MHNVSYRIWLAFKAAALSGALAATSATAAVVISYPTFTGACNGGGLTCVGSTNVTPAGALRLSTANPFTAGAGYSTTAVTLGAGSTFSTVFQFRITNRGGIAPADGITFVVSAGTNGLGVSGGGLGYQGVPKSVAVEFDTFNNGENGGSNHVGVDVNGVLANNGVSPYGVSNCTSTTGYVAGCMSNGDVWTAIVDYDGTANLLDVFVQDGAGAVQQIIDDYSVNLSTILGTSSAFVGFTSATGSGWSDHDILSWRLDNDRFIFPTPTVPEPATLALVGSALLGLGIQRRRKHLTFVR